MAEAGYRKAILGVALASALLCLPFLGSLPLFDPDEGYYPAAAAESLREGHPLDLTLNGEPRWNKPPLSYALMQVSMLALGKNEFAVRLPSVLEGAALVAVVGLLTMRVAGGRAGLLAAVVLASSLGHQVMGRAAHPEMGLVLGTVAAQLLFAIWFVSPPDTRPRGTWWLAGLAMGFGFLAKGPTALLMPALMLVAGMLVVPKEGRPSWGNLGRVSGLATLVCLAIAAPWFLWMASKHGIDFWRVSAGQVEDYVVEGRRGFRSNPLFFVVVLPLAFLPWIALLPSALRGLRRTDPSPAARFSLLMALAAGTSFLFWSLWPAKNPHYALVFLAPLAAIVGGWFAEWSARPMAAGSWDVRSYRSVAVIAVACVLAIAVGLAVGLRGPNPLVSPSKQFAERIREEPGWEGATLAVYRRRLPSLSFYAGRAVAWPQDPEALAPFLTAPGTRFLVIRARHLDPRQGGMGIGYASTDEPWVLIRLDGPSDLRLSPPPPAPGAAPPAGGPR